MYLEHFGINELPFTLTPNTQYYCNLVAYESALNVLLFGLQSNEGFIKIVGEVGTGKTLICRKLLNVLEDPYVTAYIPDPDLTPNGLRKAFASELGIDYTHLDETDLREKLTDELLRLHLEGKKVVLIVDESQVLPDDTLEALRLLTNLETESTKLLQIVLFGQPELDQRLRQYQFRQLTQRITFSYELCTLSLADTKSYIFHRLSIAGYRKGNLFTRKAIHMLAKHSYGTPRLINVLCHKAMLVAYGRGERRIGKKAAKTAISDTYTRNTRKPSKNKPILWAAGLTGLIMMISTCYMHYIGKI